MAIFSEHFTVAPNTWYELNAKGVCGAGAMYLQLQFYNAAGGALRAKEVRGNSRILGGRFSRDLSGWMPMFTLYQAPAGAVSARFTVNLDLPGRNTNPSYFTQPYVGVATSALQETPTPWSPPGLGTQIHGGMIKTNTIHANAIAVDRLSAFTSNLGSVTAGDVYGVTVRGGNFGVSNAWPRSGGGFHMSNSGLRVGNRNTGRWVEITSNGDFDAPGFRINNGTMDIDHLNVIKSSNIRRGAISKSFTSSGLGAELTVVVDQIYPNIHDVNNTATVFVFYGGSVNLWTIPKVCLELFKDGRWQTVSTVSSAVIEVVTGGSGSGSTRKEIATPFPTREQRTQVGPGTYKLRVTNGTSLVQGFIDILLLYK